MDDDERREFAEHYGLDPETLPPRLADGRLDDDPELREMFGELFVGQGAFDLWLMDVAGHGIAFTITVGAGGTRASLPYDEAKRLHGELGKLLDGR